MMNARIKPLGPPRSEKAGKQPQTNADQADAKVFPIEVGRAVTHAFVRACKAAGIEDLHFHDLRHEATSRFFERTDLRDIEIALITGHKTMEMLKRYAHLRAGQLADRLG